MDYKNNDRIRKQITKDLETKLRNAHSISGFLDIHGDKLVCEKPSICLSELIKKIQHEKR